MKEGKPIWGIIGLAVVIIAIVGVVAFAILHNRPSELTPGTAIVELMTNGGVAYEWNYEIKDKTVVRLDKEESEDMAPGADGGPVKEKYSFVAEKEGETDIVFEYRSFLEDKKDDVMETKTYHVAVDKNLQLTITEK